MQDGCLRFQPLVVILSNSGYVYTDSFSKQWTTTSCDPSGVNTKLSTLPEVSRVPVISHLHLSSVYRKIYTELHCPNATASGTSEKDRVPFLLFGCQAKP